ncbi:MAG TPA: response regulator [Chitinophaga sp.]|uniref:response regulator n=1 Tax=Chitinophaga sp. TaxID=1869181 RepID=UPI002F925674
MEQPKQVFVIEDDNDLNDALVMLLKLAGYDVSTWLNISAFKRREGPPPDVYLIDRQLDQEDGLDLCRELKAGPVTREIPVVIMSANAGIKAASEEAGASAFLPKPFTRKELVSILQSVLTK